MEHLRERYEEYLEETAREHYRFRSGRSDRLALEEIDRRYEEIAAGELLEPVRKEYESARFDEPREGWRRILRGLEGAALAARTRPLVRELREREAAQRARIDGEERTLYAWQALLGAESDRARRRSIQDAIDRGIESLNSLREEHRQRHGELLSQAGFATWRARAEALHPGVDYERWGRAADALLEATESHYLGTLRAALARLGIAQPEATQADAARVSRLADFERRFPAERLLASLDRTTEGMGLSLADAPGVSLDDEARPGKHPRASCVAPRVPGEVYVLLAPRGGLDDYETLFHEAGHAFHFAFTSPSLPLERRRLMDPALTETFAFLLHYRVADPAWIDESPAAPDGEAFARSVRFRKLALLRRYAGKIRFELELNALPTGADPRPLGERYAEQLSRATGFRYRASGYLADTDSDFYSVDYFRAWCLEAQLAEHLRAKFGRCFWKVRRAGELLRELWSTGSTYSADGLADALGIGQIDPSLLVEELLR